MSGFPPLNGGTADDMVTPGGTGIRRHKVTSMTMTEQAYNEGRRFRAFYEFALAANEVRVLKFIIDKPVDLTFSGQFVDAGGLRYRVYGPGPVEGGTFTAAGVINATNRKAGMPINTPGITVLAGGTLDTTGFTASDQANILTAGASGQRTTIDGAQLSPRGFPTTVAYVVLDTLPVAGNAAPSGLLKYEWTTTAD